MQLVHRCPLCGRTNKTKIDESKNYKEKYLDGQHKMPFSVFMSKYYICPECGLVYVCYKGNKTLFVSEEAKKLVHSSHYQNLAKSNVTYNLKLLKLIEKISRLREIIGRDINWLYIRYYEENRDYKNMEKYLHKAIDDIQCGNYYFTNLSEGETCCKLCGKVILRENELLIDFYRRTAQFEKAKECIAFGLKNKHVSNPYALKQYYEYQLNLINNEIKRHI